MSDLDESNTLSPNFNSDGLIAAIAQDVSSRDILMLAWMNREALDKTLQTGEAWYWSRSRGQLWHKGATSGAVQKVREIRIDCDQDALILLVEQAGEGACHTGRKSCFYRRVDAAGQTLHFIDVD
jgi:phosphoribosyl-AMP cyclohydrolase